MRPLVPEGKPLKGVLTQNYVRHSTEVRVQYGADSMDGSSGSSVFNHRWQVVALHRSDSPYPPAYVTDSMKKAWRGAFRINEGVPIKHPPRARRTDRNCSSRMPLAPPRSGSPTAIRNAHYVPDWSSAD